MSVATSPLPGWPNLRESLEVLGIDLIVAVSAYLILTSWVRKGTYTEVLLSARHDDAWVLINPVQPRERDANTAST